MVEPSRYWTIIRINSVSQGYTITGARDFFHRQFPKFVDAEELSNQENQLVRNFLLSQFRERDNGIDDLTRAIAGLCLRCYISHDILSAVRRLVQKYRSEYYLRVEDILPIVLNDDGQSLIILNDEGTSQLILNNNGETQESRYNFFTVEVLRTFQQNAKSQSLTNWTYTLTHRNSELKNHLSQEYGLCLLSDWALLNRAKPEHLEGENRQILEVFHRVYRRDRRNQRQSGRCPDPSRDQLTEMLRLLQAQGIRINSPSELRRKLERIAVFVRQERISREMGYPQNIIPLVVSHPDTGEDIERDIPDPNSSLDPDREEKNELLDFVSNQLREALIWGIEQGICDRMAELQKSRKYVAFAGNFIPWLQLFYCQGMSQSQIAQQFGMTQCQFSRVLQPTKLLTQVRFRTLDRLLSSILKRARELGLTEIPPEVHYLSNLVQHLEFFVDGEFFDNAAAELNARSQQRSSTYAKLLCEHLDSISRSTSNLIS
ncbi:MAG TPA: hypothetical protein DEG17_26600 [Cyanobacteria bacterium UBA11149]|nr:hypothetical protein [Cyanobacteria bacterium UBA11366]HBK62456.1 hypothetical protein [Cyanobacteria bacterium UBA11166]HBR72604.1 hypothetical protein [Cyanobacteria bacterium UBA11159]HBS71175.1 hypothetical protein [Cyanobacteria bacterium UBA11153]HBW92339.1 hypothetical protein [Cyanobacteria bacterium UBA11149]HCA96375.1 hypothetical protein [Cyanobacteria bacterium UBA9226]